MKIFSDAKPGQSERSFLVVLLLCIFLGWLGVHRFYVGKIWTGFFYLLTFGFFGIGTLLDFVMIACQQFTDKEGLQIRG